VGTFGGALEARQINASDGRLWAEVKGEIETEDRVLVIKRIHVIYHLKASTESSEVIEQVHRIHAEHCPVYQSLYRAIGITTEYRLEESA
jgi:uncharacterized OsmC-like protein